MRYWVLALSAFMPQGINARERLSRTGVILTHSLAEVLDYVPSPTGAPWVGLQACISPD